MRVCGGALGIVLALIVLITAAPAEADSEIDLQLLQREIQALRHGQAAIRKELRELKALLLRQPQVAKKQPDVFSPTDMTVAGAPFMGRADAPVTLVEFSDFQCPYCRRHAERVLPRLIEQYVETGKVKYVMRQFPIEQLHPFAIKASEAALCAGDQGKYWQMHELIFANQKQLAADDLKSHAAVLALDGAAFDRCLETGTHAERVRLDQRDG